MPDILTSDQFETWLPGQLLGGDVQALLRAVGRAERHVIGRYRARGKELANSKRFFTQFSQPANRPVLLDGWEEQADGTPDVAAMDDGLVEALRDTIARIVEYRLTAPDKDVASKSQGARSVTYRPRGMPADVYAPLDLYDKRTPAL